MPEEYFVVVIMKSGLRRCTVRFWVPSICERKESRAQKIKNSLEKNRQHMVIYVQLSTLTYLKKGGRISSVA